MWGSGSAQWLPALEARACSPRPWATVTPRARARRDRRRRTRRLRAGRRVRRALREPAPRAPRALDGRASSGTSVGTSMQVIEFEADRGDRPAHTRTTTWIFASIMAAHSARAARATCLGRRTSSQAHAPSAPPAPGHTGRRQTKQLILPSPVARRPSVRVACLARRRRRARVVLSTPSRRRIDRRTLWHGRASPASTSRHHTNTG